MAWYFSQLSTRMTGRGIYHRKAIFREEGRKGMEKTRTKVMVILMAMVLLCLLLPFTSAYADVPYTLTGTSLSWDQIYNRGVVTQEGLSLSWKAGNAPVDYYDVCFNLYRDAALSEVLSYEPGYDTDYYFERIISNETDNDHSMVFTELTAANCTVTITGYDAECVSVTPGTSDDGKDYVTILYKIRRQDSAPSTPYTLTGTSLSWESVDNIVAWGISQDGLLLNWKDGNAPASNEYLDVCFNLYKDAALSQVIDGEPDYNTDYYFKREIFNEIDNNHSMVFTELTAADCTVTITGYNAECVSVTPETQHNGVDYVSILYKIRRQGSAPVPYPIWVGSTQVTSTNKNDILGDGGKAKYNPDTHTLTLNNPTITGIYNDALIYAEVDLTVTGSATLNSSGALYAIASQADEHDSKDLTINGNIISSALKIDAGGDLLISGGSISADGISGSNVTITGGTVTATGNETHFRGLSGGTVLIQGGKVTAGSISGGSVMIEDGEVTAENTETYGIQGHNSVTIKGGTVNATGKDYGICGYSDSNSLEVTGGKVTAKGTGSGINFINITVSGSSTSVYSESTSGDGIHASTITVDGGTLEGKGITRGIYAGTSITMAGTHGVVLPEGGKLSSDGKTVCESDGTTVATHAKVAPKAVTYPVWVQGVQVNDSNKNDVLGDGKVKYDPTSQTLTLSGASISDTETMPALASDGIDLTVTGTASFTGSGLWVVFSDNGSMILDHADIKVIGGETALTADLELHIIDSTITAKGYGWGIVSYNLTISGSTVTAETTSTAEATAIYAEGDISISDADVKATTGDGLGTTGIYSKIGNITISGGTVTVTAGEGGIYAYTGSVIIKNGTKKVEATTGTVAVRGKTGITIGDELMIKIPSGGTVGNISGSYNIMDGTTAARHALIVPKGTASPSLTSHTVKFVANGHGTAPAAQTVEDGKTAAKPADPTETGWTFGGWYKEATCTNAFDFSSPITSDITLYAKWTATAVTYTVTGGGNSTWTYGSNSGITIIVKRSMADDTCFSHFSNVQIDGTALAAGDYEAKPGSTVITLKAAALQKLSYGSHTITINFDDNKAETKLTIKAASLADTTVMPKTGDSADFSLWLGLILLGFIGISFLKLTALKHRK